MTTVFVSILERGMKEGVMNRRVADAREWFRNEAARTSAVPSQVIRSSQVKLGGKSAVGKIGKLLLFSYDPKEKLSIPYYDKFPIVFPFRIVEDGFYGINMHYLPYQYRAVLMDNLYTLTNNKAYDDTTHLRLSYQLLSSYSRLRYFKPCVKRYLNSQIRSSIITIPADQWDIALFLPLERFAKAAKSVVHMESVKTIRGM